MRRSFDGPGKDDFVDQAIDESRLYSIVDQVIDESAHTEEPVGASKPPGSARSADRHPASTESETTAGAAATPRERQRQRTRQTILDATVRCLVEDGYGALTTRHIAERAGIAQSTLMHHFETRELLLVEAVASLAESLAHSSLSQLDLSGTHGAAHREAVLDQAWATFTSPEALAAAQLWGAAWSEPEIAAALRDLEVRVAQLILTTAGTVFPEETQDPRFPIFIDGAYQLFRGLVMAIPTWGKDVIDARWSLLKPVLVDVSMQMLPPRD